MHLAADADAGDLRAVDVLREFGDTGKHSRLPVFRLLLGPAGMRKLQRILAGGDVENSALAVHEQGFQRGSAEIDADVIHSVHLT